MSRKLPIEENIQTGWFFNISRWKKENNELNRCAGCGCYLSDEKRTYYKKFYWCKFCKGRRVKGVPIQGTMDGREIK